MKIWKKILITTLFVIIPVTAIAGEKDSTVDKALQRGVLKVGMDIFQPWAMKDKNGRLIGFEIDVATKLAKDMGISPEFIPTAWSGIIPALLTKKFDVIIGGMGITEKRKKKVAFTDPYDFTGMAIVAHKKRAAGMNTLEDFNDPKIEIAVKLGTTAAAAAQEFFPNAKLRLFDTEPASYQELRNGQVHAVVGSVPKPAFEAVEYSDILFTPVQGAFTKEPIGFALRKKDEKSIEFFNKWIAQNQKWLQERHQYWFETKDWENQVR